MQTRFSRLKHNFIKSPNLNSQINLTICVRNNPPLGDYPNSIWNTSIGTTDANMSAGPPDEIFCFSKAISVLETNHYTNYTLTLSYSNRDSKSFTFVVIQPSDPTSPINFKVSECSSSTATIIWTAGLSGNAPTKRQAFHILYYERDSVRSSELQKNIATSNSSNSKWLTNGSENEMLSAQLDDLKPGTQYEFALYAENDNGGKSNLTNSANCTTKPLSRPISTYHYRTDHSTTEQIISSTTRVCTSLFIVQYISITK